MPTAPAPPPAAPRTRLALALRRRRIRERRATRVMIAICLAGGALFLLAVAPLLDPGLAEATARGSETEAYIYAREFVADALLSPASAKFPWLPDSARYDGQAWRVAGYVDSQNRFGALIRSHWRCELRKNGGQWQCLSLTVAGSRIR